MTMVPMHPWPSRRRRDRPLVPASPVRVGGGGGRRDRVVVHVGSSRRSGRPPVAAPGSPRGRVKRKACLAGASLGQTHQVSRHDASSEPDQKGLPCPYRCMVSCPCRLCRLGPQPPAPLRWVVVARQRGGAVDAFARSQATSMLTPSSSPSSGCAPPVGRRCDARSPAPVFLVGSPSPPRAPPVPARSQHHLRLGGTTEPSREWMAYGNCANLTPAVFFSSHGGGVEAARWICVDCPVRSQCLEYALANRIGDGVWGGTSERERRAMLSEHDRSYLRPPLTVRTRVAARRS
jgi:WhiB family transcriptional regulator, redox-sensing transcriptional regulator